ncbi:MAG: hypothetical protein E7292_00775 [Lachnospiraceae bacterium]|nr:hypothetical protein [Lachnospiraceae bacterium]
MGRMSQKRVSLFMAVAMFCMFAGCGLKEPVDESMPEESISQSTEQESSASEALESVQEEVLTENDDSPAIQYGDMIQVSLMVSEQKGVVEDLGESEIVVAETSKEFQPEYAPTEEVIAKNVEKAIGKHVGDTFTLWYEGGDGRYAYEYTILEIMDKPADVVSYGDRIQTSCVKKISGDEYHGGVENKEEAELTVSVSDYRFNAFEMGCDWQKAEENVAQVLGKGVGDTFSIEYETTDGYMICEYTILGIEKCVEYGDNIKVSCRWSSFLAGGEQRTDVYESVELPVWSKQPAISMEGNELSVELTRGLFQELMGKKVGDTVLVCDENMDMLTRYTLTIMDVSNQPEGEADLSGKEYFLAKKDDMEVYCSVSDVGYWVLVNDSEQKIMHEYYWSEDCIDYNGSYAY